MMAMGGNSMEQTLAMLTGGAEITQEAGELGNALKIGQMRAQGMKGKLEELGEEIDENVDSISKFQTHILNLTKSTSKPVNVFRDDGTFKTYYDTLQEVSEIIDELSDTDRADLIETLFGKNRANQGMAVIQAFQSGRVQKALEAASNAEGSALAEQQKWLESIEAKTQQFAAAFQELSNTIINSDWIKTLVDSGTTLLSTLTQIIDKVGSLPVLITAITSAAMIKKGGRDKMFSLNEYAASDPLSIR